MQIDAEMYRDVTHEPQLYDGYNSRTTADIPAHERLYRSAQMQMAKNQQLQLERDQKLRQRSPIKANVPKYLTTDAEEAQYASNRRGGTYSPGGRSGKSAGKGQPEKVQENIKLLSQTSKRNAKLRKQKEKAEKAKKEQEKEIVKMFMVSKFMKDYDQVLSDMARDSEFEQTDRITFD